MSNELTKARTQLMQAKSHVKQNRFIPAVQNLYEALATVLRTPLMKAEKEEFTRLLEDSASHLGANAEFRKLIPLQIKYQPGEEREFMAILRECLNELQQSVVSEAKDKLAKLAALRAETLKRGEQLLADRKDDEARDLLNSLIRDHDNDPHLRAEIGEIYLRAAHYEDAYEHLSQALEDSPESLHLYNRVGMALRKLGRFDTAEKYYFKAKDLLPKDPNIYFNLGRLYVDWRQWDKVVIMSKKALSLNPNFLEAKKMLAFAQKQMRPQ
jgi:tetratricopeptide (TPR) repeat protein